jgi:hypothetical protein
MNLFLGILLSSYGCMLLVMLFYKSFRKFMDSPIITLGKNLSKAIDSTHKKPYKNLHSNHYYKPEEIYTDKIKEYIQLGYIVERRDFELPQCILLDNGSINIFFDVETLSLLKINQEVNIAVMKQIENKVELLLNPKLKSITKNNKQLTCCATGDLLTEQEVKDSKWCNDCKIVISPNTLLLTNDKCLECKSRSLTKYKQ